MEFIESHKYLYTTVYYLAGIIGIILCLFIFELVTKYKNWEEIRKGNLSVAMATSGKIFGVANIFRFSIEHNDRLGAFLLWGAFGFLLLLLAYWVFEFLTISIKVDEEIGKDNRAVGLLSMLISIGMSFVIGASIT